jgi:uncharacterized membrane protein YozB (DUF420 family)
MIESLPHINASLNMLATLLLVVGIYLIKMKRETAHKRAMLSAFAVSCVFLVCYLVYHANVGSKEFSVDEYGSGWYTVYLLILLPHIVLAATVPFLGVATIFLGLTDRRENHRLLARITFPIWLYVSVSGVLVYLFLYWWFPPINAAIGAGP